MLTILFYSPFNNRSRDTESLMIGFKKQGHRVISLSQSGGRFIHAYLQSQGIETHEYQTQTGLTILYFLKHILFFVRFCRKNKVDIVYSHLESANFVASIGQYFIGSKVYLCRHHIDEAALQGFDKSIFYKLTYALAKKIIVVSDQAARYMVQVEKIKPSKIIKINLAYDFSLYAKPGLDAIKKIKEQISADLILLTACRLTKYKRTELSIQVLKKLVEAGINAKRIILGRGEEEFNLRSLAGVEGVSDRLIMPGYVNNVTDYLAACDLLLHPSVLESSCVTVKEAGITNLPVIVCKGVGDFDDYIVPDENGFVVSRENFVEEATTTILSNYKHKEKLGRIAINLQAKVHALFNIDRVIVQYKELNTHE